MIRTYSEISIYSQCSDTRVFFSRRKRRKSVGNGIIDHKIRCIPSWITNGNEHWALSQLDRMEWMIQCAASSAIEVMKHGGMDIILRVLMENGASSRALVSRLCDLLERMQHATSGEHGSIVGFLEGRDSCGSLFSAIFRTMEHWMTNDPWLVLRLSKIVQVFSKSGECNCLCGIGSTLIIALEIIEKFSDQLEKIQMIGCDQRLGHSILTRSLKTMINMIGTLVEPPQRRGTLLVGNPFDVVVKELKKKFTRAKYVQSILRVMRKWCRASVICFEIVRKRHPNELLDVVVLYLAQTNPGIEEENPRDTRTDREERDYVHEIEKTLLLLFHTETNTRIAMETGFHLQLMEVLKKHRENGNVLLLGMNLFNSMCNHTQTREMLVQSHVPAFLIQATEWCMKFENVFAIQVLAVYALSMDETAGHYFRQQRLDRIFLTPLKRFPKSLIVHQNMRMVISSLFSVLSEPKKKVCTSFSEKVMEYLEDQSESCYMHTTCCHALMHLFHHNPQLLYEKQLHLILQKNLEASSIACSCCASSSSSSSSFSKTTNEMGSFAPFVAIALELLDLLMECDSADGSRSFWEGQIHTVVMKQMVIHDGHARIASMGSKVLQRILDNRVFVTNAVKKSLFKDLVFRVCDPQFGIEFRKKVMETLLCIIQDESVAFSLVLSGFHFYLEEVLRKHGQDDIILRFMVQCVNYMAVNRHCIRLMMEDGVGITIHRMLIAIQQKGDVALSGMCKNLMIKLFSTPKPSSST
eukprot:TRINITY_DN1247_c0_g1_i3.p1 TRINITY_DN1247_c0_g1~~TRINITY_DN1247_c0_g1_i3.p1  ORF type:complete len:752 (+),score=168.46 TRINITY_DN1247_c0_g1_i3:195-2450(+)